MKLKLQGDHAPNFELYSYDQKPFSLENVLNQGQNVFLVFLRHLGWLPCREHAAQLCQRQEEFKKLNTRVVIISFGTLPALNDWIRDVCGTFDVVIDRELKVYRAYQLERSKWRAWGPKTIWMYIKLLLKGRKWVQGDGDTAQMGGDFIIDAKGMIQLAHRSHDPTDRPKVDDLIKVLENLNR